MKKSIFSCFMAAAALVGFSACSSDEPMTDAGDGNVSFTLELPAQIQSRAFSDGTTATELTYTVYDEDNGSTVVKTDKATFTNLKTTVSLSLVTGKSYSIVFWASKPGNSYYTYDAVGKTITVDYNGDAQDEGRDAFFAARETFKVTGPMSETITLKRPFAQINVGTTDWQAALDSKLDMTATGMTVTGVYNSFNLATGELIGDPVNVTFTNAALPGDGESLTGESLPAGLKYLAMNYVLVGEKITVDVTLNTTCNPAKPALVFSQVPVQRNFRTNIYGALLTHPTDFNVNIDQNFEKPDYKYEVVAHTAGDFIAAILKPGDTKIIVDKSLDLSQIDLKTLAFHDNKTIEMKGADAELKVAYDAPLTSYKSLTINGGKITNMGGSKGIRTGANVGAKQLIVARAGKLELNGVTMVCDTTYHWHGPADNTSAVTYWDIESVTIKDCNITSGMFTVCGMGRSKNDTKVLIENSTFESNSSNAFSHWAYCLRLFGSTGEVNNCTVKGIQGGLSTETGMQLTINGGKYITVNTPGREDAFYPVYVTGGAVVTINGGEYIGGASRSPLAEGMSTLVSGDNDINLPDGSFIINYGKFSGKAYDHLTKTVYNPANGKAYIAIEGDENLKWEVKQ